MLFAPGYFAPGLFAPGYFGSTNATPTPVVLPLAPDELTARWLGDAVSTALTGAGQTLRVWVDEIPAVKPGTMTEAGIDTRFPAVLIKLHDSRDQNTVSGIRVLTTAIYQVQVIDQGNACSTMSGVANLIDQALIATPSGPTRDGRYWVTRPVRNGPNSQFRYTERSEATGFRYNHQGGLYTVQINAMFTTQIPF